MRLYGNTMNNICAHAQMYTHIYAVNPCHVKIYIVIVISDSTVKSQLTAWNQRNLNDGVSCQQDEGELVS